MPTSTAPLHDGPPDHHDGGADHREEPRQGRAFGDLAGHVRTGHVGEQAVGVEAEVAGEDAQVARPSAGTGRASAARGRRRRPPGAWPRAPPARPRASPRPAAAARARRRRHRRSPPRRLPGAASGHGSRGNCNPRTTRSGTVPPPAPPSHPSNRASQRRSSTVLHGDPRDVARDPASSPTNGSNPPEELDPPARRRNPSGLSNGSKAKCRAGQPAHRRPRRGAAPRRRPATARPPSRRSRREEAMPLPGHRGRQGHGAHVSAIQPITSAMPTIITFSVRLTKPSGHLAVPAHAGAFELALVDVDRLEHAHRAHRADEERGGHRLSQCQTIAVIRSARAGLHERDRRSRIAPSVWPSMS